jgi:proteasome lid subunit RPN8/RPN11
MCRQLAKRGGGTREAGAFLLGHRDDKRNRITRIVYLDDLDPDCLTGGITFDGRAYSALWDICDEHGLQVLGDVHTHPGRWVAQSDTDSDNPMLAREGHVALILPNFSRGNVRPSGIGVHRFSKSGWSSWLGRDAASKVRIGWF